VAVAPALAYRPPRLASKHIRQAVLVWCFLAPSLAIFLLYRIIPLLWNVALSFSNWSPLKAMRWAGLDQYEDMLHDDVFWQSLWNTLIFIASAPVGIVIALGLALLVSSEIRGRDVYRTIIFISYPLMTVAVAIIWRWLFDERVGLINYVARSLDLVDRPIQFLNSFVWALPSVIVANIWQMLGFYMIILLTGLQNIPPSLYEAAGARAQLQQLFGIDRRRHLRVVPQHARLPVTRFPYGEGCDETALQDGHQTQAHAARLLSGGQRADCAADGIRLGPVD